MVAITYTKPIDGHVHLRGDEYAHIRPSFAELAFRDAEAAGLAGLCEEPNAEPYVVDKETALKRVAYIDTIKGKTEHAMAVAITGDPIQIEKAIWTIWEMSRVPTGKTFFSPTTKSEKLEIIVPQQQNKSWKVLSNTESGNITREMHLEDKDTFQIEYDPLRPETHAYRQGPESEVIQFERQFGFAYDAKFKGIFLVKHTSNPETIQLGRKLVREKCPKFRVMYETTWHHMFLNIEEDYPLHGNWVKMNPPLRSKKLQEGLLESVIAGHTHTIGSDHAPHDPEQKIGLPYKSGIPAILFYPKE